MGSLIIAVLAQFGVYVASIIIFLLPKDGYKSMMGLSIATPSVSIFTDVSLAISLMSFLRRQRSAVKRTESVIQRLVVYTIGTGFITGACALVSLAGVLISTVGTNSIADATLFVLPAKCKSPSSFE